MLVLLGSVEAVQTSMLPVTRLCANTTVFQLFLLWLFDLLLLDSVFIITLTAKLCSVAACQHPGISRVLRRDEWGLSHHTYSVFPLSQRLTLNQAFQSNAF